MLTVHAPAKINLVLEVLGRQDDYHRIASIIHTIDLCDVLEFCPDEEIRFECDAPGLEQDNLVVRAATMLRARAGYSLGVRMTLRKNIPLGGGLGGGSSDAAATLLALNELWRLRLSLPELVDIASRLGSDVPFFVHGGTALVEGRGETVTPLPSPPPSCFVLLVPPVTRPAQKTKAMYGRLDATHFTEGRFTNLALETLRQGKMVADAAMFNAFERVAFDFFPRLDRYRRLLEGAGARSVHLAGSGPCLFSVFSDGTGAREAASHLREQAVECHVVSSFRHRDGTVGR